MNSFATYLERELPKIEDCLRRHVAELNPYVRPTAEHVLKAGGKRLRPLLTILTARALGYSREDIYPLACSLELLHSATLLHDDILDGASLRRGQPAAHTLFGTTHTILAGDVLLALANTMVASYDKPVLTACLSDAIMRTVSGEIQEISHIRDVDLTMSDYLEIIIGKTACLIQSACQAGALLADAEPSRVKAASEFGMNLGVAFQLVDDALDYTSPKEVSGKPKGSDIREGKLTLPLILHIQNLSQEEQKVFTKAFKENTLTEDALESALLAVTTSGYADKTRDMAVSYLDRAKQCLDAFPATEETELLYTALEGMARRDK
ncbi:MAG: polyprenyl synthetase family protein [Desulfovibrio sp.]|nr:polyprenyl synthetase family protein [Desulfovibrio sp.]MBI4958029.1 polyprenyl synthetase family protein [Desulfovibrio sp.]